MDDIVGLLRTAGVPVGLILLGAMLLYLADKLRLWDRPARNAAAEGKFRDTYLQRLETVEASCDALRGDLLECHESHSIAVSWLVDMRIALRRAGVTDLPPLPPDLIQLAKRLGSVFGDGPDERY